MDFPRLRLLGMRLKPTDVVLFLLVLLLAWQWANRPEPKPDPVRAAAEKGMDGAELIWTAMTSEEEFARYKLECANDPSCIQQKVRSLVDAEIAEAKAKEDARKKEAEALVDVLMGRPKPN